MSRLKTEYIKNIKPKLLKELNLKNMHQVPCIRKVTINIGVGSIKDDKKALDVVSADLAKITGQKPIIRKAKKAISSFKIRKGDTVGLLVTLRDSKMYDFIDRLVNITLPRIRDFRGLNPNSFDSQGNYSIGIKEHIIFPEIKYENVSNIYSLEITLTTNVDNKKAARALLNSLGFPFKETKNEKPKTKI